ncbi:DUF1613-domain-containing protein [Hortaea werneckii]|nr:DUF1613-domain-containing protein [Hortaea werneckii]KAI7101519.1 DUF1613-domain-containing protein [Hortaea werneckii]KAI7229200.1 DUF1613-domain-containing protein [Hortaea werneckii]KAI7336855.1 DUF1613-domain-containing protein [Hortaea werneckii]KAI7402261.1 DUF1613-domain-containing protein [Hortaea werneckii]
MITVEKPCDKDAGLQGPAPGTKFSPTYRDHLSASLLPDEIWITILESRCTFPPEIFERVMLNLIKNPNVTSSHLFRADVYYDSGPDRPKYFDSGGLGERGWTRHLKPQYRPRAPGPEWEEKGYEVIRTIVREMIPRNPQLDRPLVQTCHFMQSMREDEQINVVLYVPHVDTIADMPFYHPAVSQLAFIYTWRYVLPQANDLAQGSVAITYRLFDGQDMNKKLERTALRLGETIHKHGQGQLAGYEKRVHLDQIIPQKRYQDTYTRLKAKYGRQLSEKWVEVTDPGKHVFEDIGIAAFLIELWKDMYSDLPKDDAHESKAAEDPATGLSDTVIAEERQDGEGRDEKPPFPGFVDIGCGNGILVYILLAEGYRGWGFDARQRKTWTIFPPHIQACLQQKLLVPELLHPPTQETPEIHHSGVFEPRTFIVSNHADELTAWTPLLAHLNQSAFIAIPCCSHDLTGSRFRAPAVTKAAKQHQIASESRLPQQEENPDATTDDQATSELSNTQAAETGTLKKSPGQKSMPSAYATLCSYICSLSEEVGYEPEKEVLRIPSTRNQSIIGRRRRRDPHQDINREGDGAGKSAREEEVVGVVERELGMSVQTIGGEWIARAEKLARKPGSGH